MSVDDLTCDVEPEAQAVSRSVLAADILRDPAEWVEQRREHRCGDRRPLIVYGHDDVNSRIATGHTDGTLAMRDRVTDQIREHLLDAIWIPFTSQIASIPLVVIDNEHGQPPPPSSVNVVANST